MTTREPRAIPRRPGETSRLGGGAPALSILLAAFDEADCIGPVLDELAGALEGLPPCEVIVVDDGSRDGTDRVVAERFAEFDSLALVRHGRRIGKSGALVHGTRAASADWIATMDADGQNDPRDIARLLAALEPVDGRVPAMVYGIRTRRRDTLSRRAASRFANRLRRTLLRDDCPDSACGLKLIHREVFLGLPFFDGLHRFLPALAQAQGYAVRGIHVDHRPRKAGRSKVTNLGRAAVGLFDLLGAMWLMRRSSLAEVGAVTVERPAATPRAERARGLAG